MIQIKYISLFEVELLHDYYRDKLCKDFFVTPSLQSVALLQNFGLRFISTPSGFKVFARVDEINNKNFLKTQVPEKTRFVFLLFLKNPGFTTFSQVDLKAKTDQHYYFNNLGENLGANDTALLITNSTDKKVSNSDLMTFKSGAYAFTNNVDIDEKQVKLVFTDTGEQFQQVLDADKSISRKLFSFDLTQATGRAKIFSGADEKESFYVMNQSDRQDLFAVIEIFSTKDLKDKYQFIKKSNSPERFEVSTVKYKIPFASRRSVWRYNVARKFNKNITGISIKKESGSVIEFESSPGSTSELFIMNSKTPLTFSEETVTGIKLSDNNGQAIINHLPNPSLQLLKEESGKVFSDIFITI
jgi:hypothetical protein